MMDTFSLKGKTALVTGSSRGIGRAMLLAFAEAGADVVVHGTRKTEALEEAVREAEKFGTKVYVATADLSDSAAVKEMFEGASAQAGGIDVLVLNASLQIRKSWEEIPSEDFDSQMHINVRASMEMIQMAVPHMKEKHWGRILAIGSVQQFVPHPDMLVYAASKCAQMSMVHSLAKQLAPEGITVNNLAPGVILTDRNIEALADEDYRQVVMDKIPCRIFGEGTDCAGAALLLCSEAGRYITGVDLPVDGGMSL